MTNELNGSTRNNHNGQIENHAGYIRRQWIFLWSMDLST